MTDVDLKTLLDQKRKRLAIGGEPKASAFAFVESAVPCRTCRANIILHLPPGRTVPPMECDACTDHRAALVEDDYRRQGQEAAARRAQGRQAALDALRADLPGALGATGLPKHWQMATLAGCVDLPPELVGAARTWIKSPTGIVFVHGPPGCGKTYLAVSMLAEAFTAGLCWPSGMAWDSAWGPPPPRGQFLGERAYLGQLKESYDRKADPPRVDSWLLVLDDLGTSRLTDWAKGEVAGLLEDRHGKELPTIITSNLDLSALAVAVDARVASRIAESRQTWGFPGRDLRVSGTVNIASK